MAVKLNLQDLTFILKQIKIAEAHASGIKLTELRLDAAGTLLTDRGLYDAAGNWLGDTAAPKAISDPHVPYGLRTVDGTYNNLVPGRETWGSSGQPMPQLFEPTYLNDADGDTMALGPGAPVITNTNYGLPGSVADADPRIISNLVVDATLDNPAAIAAALRIAGSENVIADQRAITAAHEALKAAKAANPTGDHTTLQSNLDALLEQTGVTVTNGSIDVLNVSPDEGLSKPFNAWMTFFGQFFDHGLDLISKGGNGTVYVPLAADDPLVLGQDGLAGTADDLAPHLRFMTLTRATPVEGSQRNVTTPFVDQNQTYTSNASHQVFLREYALVDGRPVATGRLLGGADGGLATWADVKFQARTILGIELTDADVSAVPQLLVDAYGEFVRSANGLPQVMVGVGPGGQAVYASGSLAEPLKLSAIQLPVGTVLVGPNGTQNVIEAGETVAAARTFNAFLDDIAHNAVPVTVNGVLRPDADALTGNAVQVNPQTGRNLEYDNELLDRHYVTGDGRGNENIGLTAVHHIFHSEHNRQVDAQKLTILQSGDLAFINDWLATDIAALPANFAQMTPLGQLAYANTLSWDGERLFQAARFATEMQYQHLVFEEFARKIQPLVDPFVFNPVTEIDPSIFAEFANTVYRFGHSMLTENMPRLGPDGQALDADLGLIEAFLNPLAFDNDGGMSHDESAAAIMRGMTIERGSEIDEFVVGALRNNLLGLPLDLAAINIARGRDTGTPTLNEARAQLYAATGSTFLTPYTSWVEMAANLKNPLSVVNFIAAYGTHGTVTAATTLAGKRDAAMALVFGGEGAPADRLDYLNSRGTWAGRETGFGAVDLWIGGLSEKQMPFGGMLGSTFNAIFEAQMENLQDADRFYYLSRVQGQNFLNELEQNSFSKIMLANSSLSLPGPDGIRGTADDIVPRHIGVDAFADYDFELEVNAANQLDQNGAAPGRDPTGNDPVLEAMGLGKVVRDDPGTAADEGASGFHASVNALVRRYGADGTPTGALVDGSEDGVGGAGSPVTWADLKANAAGLGIALTQADMLDAPVLRIGADGRLAFAPGSTVPQAVAVANGSFEGLALVAGQDGVILDGKGNYTTTSPAGWTIAGAVGGLYAPIDTVIDPAGRDGANVVWLRGGATLSQEGGTTLQAGVGYTYSFKVGDRTDFTWPGAEARLVAVGGAAPVTLGTLTLTEPADGQWGTFTLGTGAVPAALAGLQLRLEIRNTGSGDAQILVDDIELVRTAPAYRSDLTPAQTPGYDPAADPFLRDAAGNVLRTGQSIASPAADLDATVVDPAALNQPFATGHYLRFTGGEHVLVGGTDGNDTIITDFGDDGIWGDAGDDRIEAGAGVDLVNGGAGDDIITDSGDTGDFLKGEDGNDVIANSNGIDILMGGRGKDAIFVGVDATEVFAGEGDDFVLGGDDADFLMGNEGDDWIEGGGGFDTTAGDNSELFFNSAIKGHDVMFAGGDEHDFDAESGDDIMVQGESVMRNEGMFGFDWAIYKGNQIAANADMRIPIFTTEEADILRNRFDKTEGLSGWRLNDTLIGDDRTAAANADAEEPAGAPITAANEGVFFNDGLDAAGITRIAGLDQIVSLASGQQFFEAGNILLGGAGSDTLQGNGGDDILDGDRWLNVRISIRNPADANQEIATVDSLKHVFDDSAANQARGWAGKSLFELMIDRAISPTQLTIVREVVTTGATAADVDTAVFNDIRANYTITRAANGTLTVAHTTLSNPAVDDGTDTLRNIERLRFSDGTVDAALVLNQPFDSLTITPLDLDGDDSSTLVATLVNRADPITRPVSLQWQVLGDNGQWRNVTGADGQLTNGGTRFTPTGATGIEIRVVANWTSTVAGSTGAQQTASVQTAFVGNAAAEDIAGSAAPNVILGRDGDDDIEGDVGNDAIYAGSGDDRVDGGEGDDFLLGNDGADTLIGRTGNNTLDGGNDDDQLSGGHGNDTLIGGAGTDTAVFSGPIAAYSFERNAGGAVIVSDNLGAEGDGIDTLTTIEQIQMGNDLTPYALGANGTAAVDIVVGTTGDNSLSGGAGNDLVFAGAGNDNVLWRTGDGRDFVDGGAGTDSFRIMNGTGPVQQLTLAQARAQFANLSFRDDTQTVVVRNGVVIAELKNVEGVVVNSVATGAPTVTDATPTNGLVSPTEGQPLGALVAAIQDADGLGTFALRWQQSGDNGQTWIDIAGNAAGTLNYTPGQAQVGDLLRLRVNFTDGAGNPEELFSAPTGVVGDTFTGTALNRTFNGTAGDDIANGADTALFGIQPNDTMNGGGGNDILNGRGGNDTFIQTSTDGRDRVDGGAGTDTYQLNGVAGSELFRIYSRSAWLQVVGNTEAQLAAGTEIVVTRNGTGAAAIVAELDNVEEIRVNTLQVTSPGGQNGGANGGDTIQVIGSFTGTSLNFNTITIDGSAGDDTVDMAALASAHRIVFRSNGGHDTIVGTLRPQDVIELPAGSNRADYVATAGANGMTTLSNGSHTITFSAAGGMPRIAVEADGGGEGEGVTGAFAYTQADIDGLEALVRGQRPDNAGDDDVPTGYRELSGHGNNLDHPTWGSADQAFIRLTQARYGEPDANGNRAINPIFNGLDARTISNILGTQEAGLPKAGNDANIFFMAMGQYIDHGLDFLPKGGNGSIVIGAPGGGAPGSNNPADLTRGTVMAVDANGIPQHKNQTSPYIDQNQAYGSNALVGQFLRESDGAQGVGMRLLAGAPDPSNPAFNLLPTLRELVNHHWQADTIFDGPAGPISFRTYYTNFALSEGVTGTLFNTETGAFDPQVLTKLIGDFMGSGHPLLLDTNPFISVLDHFVAGDGRANENFALTSIHTVWARNHNYHVEKLLESGFEGTPEQVFQAAKMVNEAEYQRVVFDEYLETLIGGLRSDGTHGFEAYDPSVDVSISHEFAAAVFRFGHSLIGQTLNVKGADGETVPVSLFDAFLNPSNDPSVFTGPLPPGYVPQPGYAQYGVGGIIGGTIEQAAEEVDFNIVDAVRNDLVRIRADLFAFNVARGWDVGLGTLNQVRADLAASTNPYIRDAVGFAGGDLSPYASWEDFQARNGLSDAVIAQFRQAYPDLVLAAADIAAFRAVNGDIAIAMQADGTGVVKGIDRLDLWVGGLAEKHINGGVVGQTFWVVLHEQFDRLQDGDRFYYLERFDNFDFYENFVDGQGFSDIVARNTGLTVLPEHIFEVSDEDGPGTEPGDDDDDDGTTTDPVGGGEDDEDDDDGQTDPVGGGEGDDEDDDEDDDGATDPVGGGDDDDDDDGQGDGDGDGTTDPVGGGDDGEDGPGTTPPVNHAPGVIAGGPNGDVLNGTAGADTILGLDGDDNILSGGGADVIRAGNGNDFVDAGEGRDVVFAGDGDDDVLSGGGADMVYGDGGNDRILTGAGNDLVTAGAGRDTVIGGEGDDLFVAETGDGDDTYWGDEMGGGVGGGLGSDTLDMSAITANIAVNLGTGLAGRGSATSAQSGRDVLWGVENVVTGSGNDDITASDAANVMDGGEGSDTYRFGSAAAANGDTIEGFRPGDKIDLSAIDADAGQAGNQAFTLATGAAFTGVGQLLVTQETRDDGDYVVVQGNTAGDASAEFKLAIKGNMAPTAADFTL
ncbi:peroxidase family protein [Methylorubrum populi]|uniref:peroxidase family protein n=1 Tax=Methylorubrum populi TaxID=223967 RepID=UPI003F656000